MRRCRSQPGRNLAPKTLQGRTFIDLGSFSGRFCMDFNNFRKTFNATFQNSIVVYDINGPTILAPIQIMWPGGVRASRLNPPPLALAREQCVLNWACNSCQAAQIKITRTFCPIPNSTSFNSTSTPLKLPPAAPLQASQNDRESCF